MQRLLAPLAAPLSHLESAGPAQGPTATPSGSGPDETHSRVQARFDGALTGFSTPFEERGSYPGPSILCCFHSLS